MLLAGLSVCEGIKKKAVSGEDFGSVLSEPRRGLTKPFCPILCFDHQAVSALSDEGKHCLTFRVQNFFSGAVQKCRQFFSWLSAEIFGGDQVVVGNVKLWAQGSCFFVCERCATSTADRDPGVTPIGTC